MVAEAGPYFRESGTERGGTFQKVLVASSSSQGLARGAPGIFFLRSSSLRSRVFEDTRNCI